MASPLAHLAAGCLVARLFRGQGRTSWARLVAAALFFSLLPDLDVLPGWWTGSMNFYHNRITHSLFFGALACLALAPLFKRWLPAFPPPRLWGFSFACYGLHLGMDFLTYGRGLMLFWPFSDRRFRAPWTLFRGLRWSEGWRSPEHLLTLAQETLLVAAGAALLASAITLKRLYKGTAEEGARHV